MPSKRKKNKRRMRRVQAQRRLLEEQHAASPPVKASPAIAVGAPGTVTKKAAKTPKSAPAPKVPEVVPKVPQVVPIAVPIVQAPTLSPKPEPPKKEPIVTPAPVKTEVPPEPEVVVPEQTPVEIKNPEVPAPVITEEPLIESPPLEAAKAEVAFVKKEEVEEPIIPVADPEIEIALPEEVAVPSSTGIQTHDVCETEPQVEVEVTAFTEEVAAADVEVDEPITEETEDEPQRMEELEAVEEITVDSTEADVKAVGSQSDEAGSESDESVDSGPVEAAGAEAEPTVTEPELDEPAEAGAVEAVTQEVVVTETAVEPEPVAEEEEEEEEEEESCSSEEEEVDAEVEVLSEDEGTVEAPAESDQITQDVHAPVVELSLEQNALPEAPLTVGPEPVTRVGEVAVDSADVMVDDFVVTESSAGVIEPKIIELLPVFEKPTVAVCEIFGPGPATMTQEPVLVTTEETLTDVAAEKCLDVEEPVSEKSEIPCQVQRSAESVQLTTMEMSVEAALNGHIVPELSIES